MALNLEYYQLTFLWLHTSQKPAIRRALLEEPLTLRREFFADFVPGTEFSGASGHDTLRLYLERIDQEIAKTVRNHSVLYWLHLYRRIGPMLSPEHSSNTDAMTTRLVRDIVECAICKYGQLADIGDIRRSSLVAADQILGGYFIRRLKKAIRKRSIREQIVQGLRQSDQFVLCDFHARDFLAIYSIEGLSYEYWLTSARLRSIGKGEVYTLQANCDLQYGGGDLNSLFTSYDQRIGRGIFLPVDVGSFVTLSPKPRFEPRIYAPIYNVSGERGEDLLSHLGIGEIGDGPVLNFLMFGVSIDAFLKPHTYLGDQFQQQRGYSLKNFLYVVAALSCRAFIPERNLSRQIEGDEDSVKLGILNALRRGYIVVNPETSSISRSVKWYLDNVIGLDNSELKSVETEIGPILSDLTLDSPAKQSKIALWSRGPRFMLIPSSSAVVVDGEGIESILRTLFVRLRHSGQERGISFEESLRSELKAAGFELVQRHFQFASGPREADAAVRVGSTLWLVEAHSMWRPLDYEIGSIDVIEQRVQRFADKLDQVATIRRELDSAKVGDNYDFSWAQRIEHCVVSPFIEWIWSRDAELWLNSDTPRILSVSELIHLLDETSKATEA
jgi:hypothetical protein